MSKMVLEEFTDEQKNFASNELNEVRIVKDEKLEEMKKWIYSGGGVCSCCAFEEDDFFILRFLRCCKFEVEETKRKILNYYQQRVDMPEWYCGRDPFSPELQDIFNLGMFLPLGKFDDEGRYMMIVKACAHDPQLHKFSDVMKASLMLLDLAMRNNVRATLYGVVAIIDLEGASMNHVLQLPSRVLKQLVHAWQGCYPPRIQAIHFINPPSFVNMVLNVLRSFMGNKLRERIHVHSDGLAMLNDFDDDVLSPEYGGSDENLDDLKNYWKGEVEENKDWFLSEEAKTQTWAQHQRRECLGCEKL